MKDIYIWVWISRQQVNSDVKSPVSLLMSLPLVVFYSVNLQCYQCYECGFVGYLWHDQEPNLFWVWEGDIAVEASHRNS